MKFKTPGQLKLTQPEFDALVKVLDRLEKKKIPAKLFDMGTVGDYEDCGSAACIKGWAQKILGRYAFERDNRKPVCWLFYPDDTEKNSPYRARRHHAAAALRNFLRFGQPRWSDAMRISD